MSDKKFRRTMLAMGDRTGIAWTDATWNPLRGCSKVSSGCKNCYAEKVAARFKRGTSDGQTYRPAPYTGLVTEGGKWNGTVRFVTEHLDDPLRWQRPRKVFVNSMSDLFHEAVPDETIAAIFGVMAVAAAERGHSFQVLTKRADRMREVVSMLHRHPNLLTAALWAHETNPRLLKAANLLGSIHGEDLFPAWLGVSCEDQATADKRIPLLIDTPAARRFVSYEPALGPVELDADWLYPRCADCGRPWPRGASGCFNPYTGDDDCDGHAEARGLLDWIIVGGESGPGARPCDVEWVRSTVRQCKAAGIRCFVKQLGARSVSEWRSPSGSKEVVLAHRKGGDPSEWPADLRVQEFPNP